MFLNEKEFFFFFFLWGKKIVDHCANVGNTATICTQYTGDYCVVFAQLNNASCDSYCQSVGGTCTSAFHETSPTNTCVGNNTPVTCAETGFNDLICVCTWGKKELQILFLTKKEKLSSRFFFFSNQKK